MSCETCTASQAAELAASLQSPFCPNCGGLLPLPSDMSPFALFGMPESFSLDSAALTAKHLELSQKLHPDRFVRASQNERLRALAWTSALNDAMRLLKSPEERANYLLKKRGIDLAAESGEAAQRRLPAEFLETALSEREELFEAQAEGDHQRASALADGIRRRMTANLKVMTDCFQKLESDQARGIDTSKTLDAAASALAHIRYDSRFLEEADRFEMEDLD